MPVESFVTQSSHLQHAEYDTDTETMTLTFQRGDIYQYAGVPRNVWQEFKQSGGGGTLFWGRIRYRYPTTKIFDPRESQ